MRSVAHQSSCGLVCRAVKFVHAIRFATLSRRTLKIASRRRRAAHAVIASILSRPQVELRDRGRGGKERCRRTMAASVQILTPNPSTQILQETD